MVEQIKVITIAALMIFFCLNSSFLYSYKYLITPFVTAPVERTNAMEIKLLNWPNNPKPSGPKWMAIIFAVKNAVNNFTTVAAPVKTETLMSSDERIFLKNLFKKLMM